MPFVKATPDEIMLIVARRVFRGSGAEARFVKWLEINQGRLQEALTEMGLHVPEGDDYLRRLCDAVLPAMQRAIQAEL